MVKVLIGKSSLRTLTIGTLAVIVSACASQPEELSAQHISEVRYSEWSCKQLKLESETIDRRISSLHGQLKKKAGDDQAQMAIGLILFWPTLFFLEGGDGPQAAEFSRLKGEREAIDRVSSLKDCGAIVPMAQPDAKQREAYNRLKELKRMKVDGLLSDAEYEAKKKKILEDL